MELPDEDAEYTEFSADELAEFFWLHYLAFTSDDRQQRLRVHDVMFAVLTSKTATALASRQRDGLSFVGAGTIENIWRSGDREIFPRLSALGVPLSVLAEVEAAVWK